MTATQAVEAIRAVETADEVKEVLMNCTQAEMLRAYKEMFGEELYDLHDKGKIDIAEKITDTIMYQREREWFQSLSFEERFEIITETTGGDALNKMCFCSNNELQEIARRLGIEFGDTQFLMSYYEVRASTINAIYQKIVMRYVEREIEKYHTGELTANELDDFLQVIPIATLKEYARGKGIVLPPDDDRREILYAVWEGILCDHFGKQEDDETLEFEPGEWYNAYREGDVSVPCCNGKGGELYTASCSVCGIKYDWDFPSYQEALKKWNERHGG